MFYMEYVHKDSSFVTVCNEIMYGRIFLYSVLHQKRYLY